VILELDHTGSGSLDYGGDSYIIHEDASISGEITCSRQYYDDHARVDCTIPSKGTGNPNDWVAVPANDCVAGLTLRYPGLPDEDFIKREDADTIKMRSRKDTVK
jgi:hypothetical protein